MPRWWPARAGELGKGFAVVAGEVEEQTATSAEMSTGMRSVAQSVQESAAAADTVLRAAGSLREQAGRLRELTVTKPVG
jgi:methyl-accepting chemotaxis protein